MSTFTHGFIALPLALAALTLAPAADNDVNPPGVNPPGMGATAQATPINTIDPVNGRPVDRSVPTLSVTSTGQAGMGQTDADRTGTGRTAPGHTGATGTVVIGFSEKSSRDKVEKAQGKEKDLYISAAQQNRVVKDGRIGDGKATHDGKAPHDGARQQDRTTPVDPANPAGPNQRGDNLNDAPGANPGSDANARPADGSLPQR